jgi:hypothetical protein
MDFIEQIKELSRQVSERVKHVETEEATKNALILPFIETLGYDIFNPTEVVPEFTCDFPGKKGQKVDYAIMKDGKPIMLFECKSATESLKDKDAAQLFGYFSYITDVKFGVLTNGVIYKFYTDIEKQYRMDTEPFLELDMRDIDYTLAEQLGGYRKESPDDPDVLIKIAKKLKYTREIKRIFERELDSPSDKFVIFFARQVYNGKLTKTIKKKFEGIVQNALNDSIDKRFKDRLKPALEPKIVTTEEEIEGFNIVCEITGPDRVDLNDRENYCNVLLDGNIEKPICRFYFDHEPNYVGFFDRGEEEKVSIDDLSDLRTYADRLKAAVRYYDGVVPPKITDTKTMQLEFWNGFKEYAQSKSTSLRLRHKTHPQHWYTISLGRPKAHIDLSVNTKSNVLTCEIYIPDSKELFNELVKHKDEIEGELNEALKWMELPDKIASRIKISKSGNIKEPDKREEQFEWFKTQAESFQKVFPKYIR